MWSANLKVTKAFVCAPKKALKCKFGSKEETWTCILPPRSHFGVCFVSNGDTSEHVFQQLGPHPLHITAWDSLQLIYLYKKYHVALNLQWRLFFFLIDIWLWNIIISVTTEICHVFNEKKNNKFNFWYEQMKRVLEQFTKHVSLLHNFCGEQFQEISWSSILILFWITAIRKLPWFSLPVVWTKKQQLSILLPVESAEENWSRCLMGRVSPILPNLKGIAPWLRTIYARH